MTDTPRDTDFTNLVEGDEITVVFTVKSDGRLSWNNDRTYGFPAGYFSDAVDRFVSKRQPRPLKPGDKFRFENGSDGADIRTLVFMDKHSVLYSKDRDNRRFMRPLKNGRNDYYGALIRAS